MRVRKCAEVGLRAWSASLIILASFTRSHTVRLAAHCPHHHIDYRRKGYSMNGAVVAGAEAKVSGATLASERSA